MSLTRWPRGTRGRGARRPRRAARATVPGLAVVPAERLDDALRAMADELGRRSAEVLEANAEDLRAARADGIRDALADRLRLDDARLEAMAGQLRALAGIAAEPSRRTIRELPGGLRLEECRRPVGVIGANFEARPNVVVDIASQFVKSRNAGVLRTGSAAIRSAIALADHVIAPALGRAGLDPAMIQLVRVPGQDSARALVSQPGLIPLVILRGSGDSTRSLAAEAARHGVRTMAHADGGGVLYLDEAADASMAETLIEASLDRLGVCNRLNLLLVHPARWDALLPRLRRLLARLGISMSLPPHAHPLGHEWALDAGHEATVTIAPADGAVRGRADRQRGDLGPGRRDRDRGPGGRRGVPRRLRRDRRVLERHHPPARRVQAAVGARDRDQHRRRARPPRPGHLPRPVPAPVRGHPGLTGVRATRPPFVSPLFGGFLRP